MKRRSFNYVRMFRQRHALTEQELANLLDQGSHTIISRIEGGEREVGLRTALALQVLFRQEPRQMFPGLYEWVEEAVMRRAKEQIDRLEGKEDQRSLHKREFLEGLAAPEGDTIEL